MSPIIGVAYPEVNSAYLRARLTLVWSRNPNASFYQRLRVRHVSLCVLPSATLSSILPFYESRTDSGGTCAVAQTADAAGLETMHMQEFPDFELFDHTGKNHCWRLR